MLKNLVLAAAAVALAGSLSLAAPAPAEAGLFCVWKGGAYVAKKPRYAKWCARRTAWAEKRAARRAARKR